MYCVKRVSPDVGAQGCDAKQPTKSPRSVFINSKVGAAYHIGKCMCVKEDSGCIITCVCGLTFPLDFPQKSAHFDAISRQTARVIVGIVQNGAKSKSIECTYLYHQQKKLFNKISFA